MKPISNVGRLVAVMAWVAIVATFVHLPVGAGETQEGKVCGYIYVGAPGSCATCSCGCSPCDAASLSTSKYFFGMHKCVSSPKQVCLAERFDQVCAVRAGYDEVDCMGEWICSADVFSSVNCAHQ
jgi:hypothetical protein